MEITVIFIKSLAKSDIWLFSFALKSHLLRYHRIGDLHPLLIGGYPLLDQLPRGPRDLEE